MLVSAMLLLLFGFLVVFLLVAGLWEMDLDGLPVKYSFSVWGDCFVWSEEVEENGVGELGVEVVVEEQAETEAEGEFKAEGEGGDDVEVVEFRGEDDDSGGCWN